MAQSRSLQNLISGSSEFGIKNPSSGASIGGPDAKAPTITLPEQDPIGDTLDIISLIAAI